MSRSTARNFRVIATWLVVFLMTIDSAIAGHLLGKLRGCGGGRGGNIAFHIKGKLHSIGSRVHGIGSRLRGGCGGGHCGGVQQCAPTRRCGSLLFGGGRLLGRCNAGSSVATCDTGCPEPVVSAPSYSYGTGCCSTDWSSSVVSGTNYVGDGYVSDSSYVVEGGVVDSGYVVDGGYVSSGYVSEGVVVEGGYVNDGYVVEGEVVTDGYYGGEVVYEGGYSEVASSDCGCCDGGCAADTGYVNEGYSDGVIIDGGSYTEGTYVSDGGYSDGVVVEEGTIYDSGTVVEDSMSAAPMESTPATPDVISEPANVAPVESTPAEVDDLGDGEPMLDDAPAADDFGAGDDLGASDDLGADDLGADDLGGADDGLGGFDDGMSDDGLGDDLPVDDGGLGDDLPADPGDAPADDSEDLDNLFGMKAATEQPIMRTWTGQYWSIQDSGRVGSDCKDTCPIAKRIRQVHPRPTKAAEQ